MKIKKNYFEGQLQFPNGNLCNDFWEHCSVQFLSLLQSKDDAPVKDDKIRATLKTQEKKKRVYL